MKPKLATKRYIFAMMGSSLGYIGAVYGITFLHDKFADGSLPAIIVSLIPVIFIILMMWSLWRYLNETDEVAYHDHMRAMMLGILCVMVLSGGWGLAELFNDTLPRISIFYVFPVFFLIYGLISCIKFKRWA